MASHLTMGYVYGHREFSRPDRRLQSTFRKRLGCALTWYQVLDNRAETTVSATLECEHAVTA